MFIDPDCRHHLGLGQVDIVGVRPAATDQNVILDVVMCGTEQHGTKRSVSLVSGVQIHGRSGHLHNGVLL